MQKLQTQGVHHITLVGADRQTSIDFWEGVLGMPFVFDQPNLDRESEGHIYFDPGDGRLITVFTNEDRKPEPSRTRLEACAERDPEELGLVTIIFPDGLRKIERQGSERRQPGEPDTRRDPDIVAVVERRAIDVDLVEIAGVHKGPAEDPQVFRQTERET